MNILQKIAKLFTVSVDNFVDFPFQNALKRRNDDSLVKLYKNYTK